ncbi:MAG: beta strand repeat-containing protein, partial [Pyrinomonadaceae bacterium]
IKDAGADTIPGNADDKTDTAVATFLVGNGTSTPGTNVVWFVNPSAPSGGDGRLTNPFNCYTGGAASCFSQTAADDPGDTIFLYSGAHNGGYALLASQKLVGQGASDTLANISGLTVQTYSDALPATSGASPTITTTNVNAVPLPAGAGNAPLLRGFTVGNTGTGTKISGTTFGTLTVGNNTTPDVTLNGTGKALDLTTGAFAASSAFASVTTTSSATQGISLAGVTGTVAFGSTTVSGATTQGILIGTTTAAINFGNTSVTGGSDGVSFQNNSAGTRTFGTLGVSGGTGSAFLSGAGGGSVTVNGAATLTSAGDVVNIANSTNGSAVNFAGGATVTKTTTGGNAVNWSGTNTGATLTFATLALTTSNGTGMNLAGGGTINVTNAAGSSISTTGIGAQVAPAISATGVAVGMNFTTIATTNSGGTGMSLSSVTGSLSTGTTNMQNPTGIGISVAGSSATLGFGTTTVNGAGSTSISLGGAGTGDSGAATFGALSVTPDSGQRGILAQQNTGLITVASGTVTTTNNTAVEIRGTSSASRTPLNIQLTTVNTTGGSTAPNGIVLTDTSSSGAPGGFRVLGTGGTCTSATPTCTGGRITATTGADAGATPSDTATYGGIGVRMHNAASVVLTRMHIDNHPNFAIRGIGVADFTLDTCVVDGDNGTSASADDDTLQNGEDAIRFTDLTGAASISNGFVAGGFEDTIRVDTGTGSLNRLTITNSTIGGRTNNGTSMDDGLHVTSRNSATVNITVTGTTFTTGRGDVFQPRAVGTSNMDVVFRSNIVSNNHPAVVTGGGGSSFTSTTNSPGVFSYEIACNKFFDNQNAAANAGLRTHMLSVFKGAPSTGQMNGTIFNNTFGTTGVAGSGSGPASDAMDVEVNGGGSGTVLIKNNVIRHYDEAGIKLIANDGSSTMNATVIGNTTLEPDANGGFGLYVEAGATATDSNTLNVRIGSATVAAEKNDFSAGDLFNASDVFIQTAGGANTAKVNLSRAGSASGTIPAVIDDDNVNPAATNTINAGTVNLVNTTPATPTAINESCSPPPGAELGGDGGGGDIPDVTPTDGGGGFAPVAPVTPTRGNVTSAPFVSVRPSTIGTAAPRTTAAATTPARTTTTAAAPTTTSGRTTTSGVLTPVINGAGGTVSVNIGTLAPSDSVTITFQVVVDNPYTGGPNVSNQGTVSGTNFTTVNGVSTSVPNTDDPAVGGPADATLTPINLALIQVNDAKEPEPATGTSQMLFTLTSSAAAGAGGITVNYSTANGGGNPATGGASCDGTSDYITASGTATIPSGSTTTTIPVTICADAVAETDETLLVNISSPSAGNIVDNQATGTITANTAGTFVISEFRTRGSAGAGDDFVELYNNSNSPLTVASSDASAGYGLYKTGADCNATPVLIATIPNGTVIPARGHYLLVGSTYSLANYGGAGAAAGNQTLTSDIEDDHNVAVFSTANVANISSANRLDAAGFNSNSGAVCDLMREGTGLAPVGAQSIEYSYFRKECDFAGGCQAAGNPKDSNNNSADFMFADTQGTFIAGVEQHLGAPGPERSTSPIRRDNAGVLVPLLDGTKASSASPNRDRTFTPAPPTAPNGVLSIRRRVQNTTGATITRLRFRIIELTTFPSPGGGLADLRAITSSAVVISGITDPATCASTGTPTTVPCQVTAQATVLETPPAQPNGGGYNSTLSVTLPGPGLANNASIDVNFALGVVQGGTFRFYIIVEALP